VGVREVVIRDWLLGSGEWLMGSGSRGCGPDAGRGRDAYARIREWRLVIRGGLAQD